VFDFPDNPTTEQYSELGSQHRGGVDYAPLSNLVNGLYQYMFILTETVYRVPAAEQKRYFNQALHGSMIWILDKLIQQMRSYTLSDGRAVAPTFENIDLGARDQAFANLKLLAEATQPTPYYDDSYAVNSANNGPYGDALTKELIPYLEEKFRITAKPEARARRRHTEDQSKGRISTYEQTLAEINERDERDVSREDSPLTIAGDAVVIDTSELDLTEVFEQMLGKINERRASAAKNLT